MRREEFGEVNRHTQRLMGFIPFYFPLLQRTVTYTGGELGLGRVNLGSFTTQKVQQKRGKV